MVAFSRSVSLFAEKLVSLKVQNWTICALLLLSSGLSIGDLSGPQLELSGDIRRSQGGVCDHRQPVLLLLRKCAGHTSFSLDRVCRAGADFTRYCKWRVATLLLPSFLARRICAGQVVGAGDFAFAS